MKGKEGKTVMRKILSMLLCLMIAMGCISALAEEELGQIDVNGIYKLTGSIPEGYTLNVTVNQSDMVQGRILADDATRPGLIFSIVFDETYAEVDRMNDLTEADLKFLEDTFDTKTGEITYLETAYGTKLMCVRSSLEGYEYASILTIYKGYMIETDLWAGAGSDGSLSDEDVQMMVDFLSNMNFESIVE